MRMAQKQAERGAARAWSRLRTTAAVSFLLWLMDNPRRDGPSKHRMTQSMGHQICPAREGFVA